MMWAMTAVFLRMLNPTMPPPSLRSLAYTLCGTLGKHMPELVSRLIRAYPMHSSAAWGCEWLSADLP